MATLRPYYCVKNDSKMPGKPFRVSVFDGVCFYCLSHAYATKVEAVNACKEDGKGYPIRFSLWDNRPQN